MTDPAGISEGHTPPKSGQAILAGVVGHPVEHSLSPMIHGIWAEQAGIDAWYVPIAVPGSYEDFAKAMDGLKTVGFRGVNVTIPHKEHALRYAMRASEAAKRAGAANMLTFSEDGAYAENSDIEGFAASVSESSSVPGTSALVLGAGGAARGVILALKKLGFVDIGVANRTPEKAAALAHLFSCKTISWDDRDGAVRSADLIVNTTSLGMTAQPPLALDVSFAKPSAIVADIVYAPLETELLKDAKARGLKTADGLSMLMHQAAPGFRKWFGGEPVVDDDLRAKLVAELDRRRK